MNHKNYEGLPLFRDMEESRIREILLTAGCYIRNFKKGNYIYEENEIIRSIGLILSGHVYMIREDLWGEKDILVRMGRGELFGENFACSPHPASSVSFYAQEEAEVLFLPYDRLLRHAGDEDVLVFIKNLIAMMTSKSQELMRKINVISRKSLRAKIQCFLSNFKGHQCPSSMVLSLLSKAVLTCQVAVMCYMQAECLDNRRAFFEIHDIVFVSVLCKK